MNLEALVAIIKNIDKMNNAELNVYWGKAVNL